METVTVILLLMLLMIIVGGYFMLTGRRPHTGGADDVGIRVIGSENSIVSVRRISDDGGYEVRVESLMDMYGNDELYVHEETLMDRWFRKDISDEERALIAEELEMQGIHVSYSRPEHRQAVEQAEGPEQSSPDGTGDDVREASAEDAHATTAVNRFEGYDPFASDSSEGDRWERATRLMKFINDSRAAGLLSDDLVAYASVRLGFKPAEPSQERTSCVDEALKALSDDEFDEYVRSMVERERAENEEGGEREGEEEDDVVHEEDVDPVTLLPLDGREQEESEPEGSGAEADGKDSSSSVGAVESRPFDWSFLNED